MNYELQTSFRFTETDLEALEALWDRLWRGYGYAPAKSRPIMLRAEEAIRMAREGKGARTVTSNDRLIVAYEPRPDEVRCGVDDENPSLLSRFKFKTSVLALERMRSRFNR